MLLDIPPRYSSPHDDFLLLARPRCLECFSGKEEKIFVHSIRTCLDISEHNRNLLAYCHPGWYLAWKHEGDAAHHPYAKARLKRLTLCWERTASRFEQFATRQHCIRAAAIFSVCCGDN
jgi:hypothetical protein